MVPDALSGVPEMPDTPPGRMPFIRLSFEVFFLFFRKKMPGKLFPGLAANQHDKSSSLSLSDSFSK